MTEQLALGLTLPDAPQRPRLRCRVCGATGSAFMPQPSIDGRWWYARRCRVCLTKRAVFDVVPSPLQEGVPNVSDDQA